jgi:hypothetical protein
MKVMFAFAGFSGLALAGLVIALLWLLALAVVVAVPMIGCAWREGGYCDRRKHRARS